MKTSSKVSFDLFSLQMSWSLWFFGITTVVYFVLGAVAFSDSDSLELSFFAFMLQPAKIYLLVLGILSISSFLPFYLQQGVTRRDYFIGTTLSAIGLSITLAAMSGIVTLILYLIHRWLSLPDFISFTSDIYPDASLMIDFAVFIVTSLAYYVAGWFIGIGFYKYSALLGMSFIALSLLFGALIDLLLKSESGIFQYLVDFNPDAFSFTLPISLLIIIFVIGMILTVIRRLTRTIPVKIK